MLRFFGQPPQAEGQIDLPVYKIGGGNLIRIVDERGQKALTQYRVLERAEKQHFWNCTL